MPTDHFREVGTLPRRLGAPSGSNPALVSDLALVSALVSVGRADPSTTEPQACDLRLHPSGRQDLNLRPLDPQLKAADSGSFVRVHIRSSEAQSGLCEPAWTGLNRSALVSALVSTVATARPVSPGYWAGPSTSPRAPPPTPGGKRHWGTGVTAGIRIGGCPGMAGDNGEPRLLRD